MQIELPKPIKNNPKYIPLFLLFFILFSLTCVFINGKIEEERLQKRRVMLGNLFFRGKVINSKLYNYGGRKYRLVCLKLDSCNRKSLFMLNERCFIKIHDNVATLSIGGYEPNFVVDYVTTDVKKNQMIYHFQTGDNDTSFIDLKRQGVLAEDVNLCN